MHQAEEGQDGAGIQPGGGDPEASVDHADHGGRQDHGGEDEALLQAESTAGIQVAPGQSIPQSVAEHAALHAPHLGASPDAGFDHHRAPGGNTGKEADDDRGRMGPGRGLEGLGRDDDTDPQDNGHARLDGHGPGDPAQGAGQAQRGHEQAVHPGVPDAGTQGLPAGVADVDGRGEGATEQGPDQRPDAVRNERRRVWIVIPGRSGTLQVLKRTDQVEQAHGQDDRDVCQRIGSREGVNQLPHHGHGQVQSRCSGVGTDRRQALDPGDDHAQQNGDQATGYAAFEA